MHRIAYKLCINIHIFRVNSGYRRGEKGREKRRKGEEEERGEERREKRREKVEKGNKCVKT